MRITGRTLLLALVVPSIILTEGMCVTLSAQENELCIMCHSDSTIFTGLPNAERLVVSGEELAESIHGMIGLYCVDCHQDLIGSEDFPHPGELQSPDCSMCHGDVAAIYSESLHGYALSRGNERAPSCSDCHGTHNILPRTDPESNVCKVQIETTCANCHGSAGLLTDQFVKVPQIVEAYSRSVHGVNLQHGITEAASCCDCHGVHDLRGSSDPESRINRKNVAETCGQCHADIMQQYERSIHGRALEAGLSDSPTCNDCHGEHLILSPGDSESRTYAGRLATETCGKCHDDPLIISKYNMQGGVVGSYVDSYHGWASARDYANSATCVSCHTAHLVLPEVDPESSIHEDNLVGTCQQCHEDGDRKFALSYTHEATSVTTNPLNRLIRNVYLLLIFGIIGGMVVHNLVILNYYAMERRRKEKQLQHVVRLNRSEVIQHLALTISFTGLVITGFALRFPEAGWVKLLTGLGMNEPLRANLHRILAVILIAAALFHLYHMLFTKRGKEQLRAMMPVMKDTTDLLGNIRYYTWLSKSEPKFGRFDYTQKAEYWALIWGTAVMALTGFILWFPEMAVRLFPSWIVMVSQTIHYYEAWLATLAIIVWHFFFVIIHPDAYPMSWTWLTGKMSVASVKEHHALWYEEELANGDDSGEPETVTATTDREAESSE